MRHNAPNALYDHVFAIIRVDLYQDLTSSPEAGITVTKVVLTEESAQRETARLNQLKTGRSVRYFWQVTRLERADTSGVTP